MNLGQTTKAIIAGGACFASLFAICLYFTNNYVVGALLIIILWGVVRMEPKLVPALIVSAILGTFGEVICCHVARLWIYANSTFWMIPWWIPVIWAILFASFFQFSRLLFTLFEKLPSKIWRRGILVACASLIVAYILFALVSIDLKFSIFFAIMIAITFAFRHDPFAILLFLVAAFCGTLGEYLCMQNGVWYYTDPNPALERYGVPLSLPLAWGLSMNIVWNIGRRYAKDLAL
jgi:hypothetical protein